jgi:hypothetical protein
LREEESESEEGREEVQDLTEIYWFLAFVAFPHYHYSS